MPPVAWQPWQTAAFLDAQRRRVPVLLLIETAWAPACAEARAVLFTRPDVQQAIADTMVPVRVDADRRPDIADRYGLGQWPSLLVLTPEGHVLTGGTRLDATLPERLRRVAEAFAAHDDTWRSGAGRAAWPGDHSGGDGSSPSVDLMDEHRPETAGAEGIAAAIWRARDPASGVFAHAGIPMPDAAVFALAQAMVTGDAAWWSAGLATLDALDAFESESREEVLAPGPSTAVGAATAVTRLEDQAAWIHACARGLTLEDDPRRRLQLDRLVRGLYGTFRRLDGHWRPWPGEKRLVLVDASALTCSALLAAAEALDRPALAQDAIETLELLAPGAYVRGAGVAHAIEDGRSRGPLLLDDAMQLAHALLDAAAWRDDDVYRDLAEEVRLTTLARLQSASGALVDRVASLAGAGRVGLLAEPSYPIVGNAAAARLHVRLHPGPGEAHELARRVLRAVTPRAAAAGLFGAPVGLAWHACAAPGGVAAAW